MIILGFLIGLGNLIYRIRKWGEYNKGIGYFVANILAGLVIGFLFLTIDVDTRNISYVSDIISCKSQEEVKNILDIAEQDLPPFYFYWVVEEGNKHIQFIERHNKFEVDFK